MCITIFYRLNEGRAAAVRAYQQTQAAFEDTSAYAEIKDELLVRQSLTEVVVHVLHVVFVYIYSLNWRLFVTREEMTTIKPTSKRLVVCINAS